MAQVSPTTSRSALPLRSLLVWGLLAAALACALLALRGEAGSRAARGAAFEAALALHEVVAEPGRFAGRRVVARGHYDLENTVFATGARRGRAEGARVFTPLRLADGSGELVVLIERGWIPKAELDTFMERDAAHGERMVYGRVAPVDFGAVPSAPRALERSRSALRPRELQASMDTALLPLMVVREAGSGVELPLAPVAAAPPGRLRGDAWWLLGVALLLGLGALSVRLRAI